MRNITVKIDDETYRKARIRAANQGTSVSAMVREFLSKEDEAESREARRIASLKKMFAEADRNATPRGEPMIPMSREEIYAERLR
ncbi:MAG: hypothetical protein HC845_06810 [Akkermansiaceae bacterium]|nr:hypothetical protein [Akkermansiaceae bacterium]